MPVTIKNAAIKYKDPTTGEYKTVDAISDGTTAERVAAIEAVADDIDAAAARTSAAIEAKAAETIASIPDDYTALSNEVGAVTDVLAGREAVNLGYEIAGASHYIVTSTGAVSSEVLADFSYTDYIDVSMYSTIEYKRTTHTIASPSVGMAFYDDTKTYISGIAGYGSKSGRGYELFTTPVPDGAKYARFSTLVDTQTYGAFTVSGKNKLISVIGDIKPLKLEATEALTFYPLAIPNGAKVNVVSKNGAAYSGAWSCLFYDSAKTNVLFHFSVNSSDIDVTKTINVDGIAYFRPNQNFSGDVFVTVLDGQSVTERVEKNAADISANEQQIADAFDEIKRIKAKHLNMYDDIGDLILGRVFKGVYSDAITTVHCTDYIGLVPGHTYALYGGFMSADYTNYYDKAKTYKGAMPFTVLMNAWPYDSSMNCALFTAPDDCYYTRINYLNADLDDGKLLSGWYLRDVTERVLAQSKVLVVGDSISTDVYGNYKKWVTDLVENGTLSRGLTYNSSKHATGFVAIYSSDTNSTFIKRVTALGDLTGYDMIVTFGGINDWIQSINFDDFKDAVDTYFAYLVENATQARIVVLSPMHTALYGTTNNVGKTQKDYADYIKEVAQAYSFPLLNLTDESGFCPDKSNTFRDMWTLLPEGFQEHDGVHPTAEWELKYLAPQIADFLEGLIA